MRHDPASAVWSSCSKASRCGHGQAISELTSRTGLSAFQAAVPVLSNCRAEMAERRRQSPISSSAPTRNFPGTLRPPSG